MPIVRKELLSEEVELPADEPALPIPDGMRRLVALADYLGEGRFRLWWSGCRKLAKGNRPGVVVQAIPLGLATGRVLVRDGEVWFTAEIRKERTAAYQEDVRGS